MKKYRMCPQCGSPLLYVDDEKGNHLFFKVEKETGEIEPTRPEYNAVLEMNLDEVKCSKCSWTGGLHKLKKVFY